MISAATINDRVIEVIPAPPDRRVVWLVSGVCIGLIAVFGYRYYSKKQNVKAMRACVFGGMSLASSAIILWQHNSAQLASWQARTDKMASPQLILMVSNNIDHIVAALQAIQHLPCRDLVNKYFDRLLPVFANDPGRAAPLWNILLDTVAWPVDYLTAFEKAPKVARKPLTRYWNHPDNFGPLAKVRAGGAPPLSKASLLEKMTVDEVAYVLGCDEIPTGLERIAQAIDRGHFDGKLAKLEPAQYLPLARVIASDIGNAPARLSRMAGPEPIRLGFIQVLFWQPGGVKAWAEWMTQEPGRRTVMTKNLFREAFTVPLRPFHFFAMCAIDYRAIDLFCQAPLPPHDVQDDPAFLSSWQTTFRLACYGISHWSDVKPNMDGVSDGDQREMFARVANTLVSLYRTNVLSDYRSKYDDMLTQDHVDVEGLPFDVCRLPQFATSTERVKTAFLRKYWQRAREIPIWALPRTGYRQARQAQGKDVHRIQRGCLQVATQCGVGDDLLARWVVALYSGQAPRLIEHALAVRYTTTIMQIEGLEQVKGLVASTLSHFKGVVNDLDPWVYCELYAYAACKDVQNTMNDARPIQSVAQGVLKQFIELPEHAGLARCQRLLPLVGGEPPHGLLPANPTPVQQVIVGAFFPDLCPQGEALAQAVLAGENLGELAPYVAALYVTDSNAFKVGQRWAQVYQQSELLFLARYMAPQLRCRFGVYY